MIKPSFKVMPEPDAFDKEVPHRVKDMRSKRMAIKTKTPEMAARVAHALNVMAVLETMPKLTERLREHMEGITVPLADFGPAINCKTKTAPLEAGDTLAKGDTLVKPTGKHKTKKTKKDSKDIIAAAAMIDVALLPDWPFPEVPFSATQH